MLRLEGRNVEPTAGLDASAILYHLDRLYENSWERLLACGGVMFALVGIGVPFLMYYLEKRAMRLEGESIRTDVVGEVCGDVETRMNQHAEKMETRLKKDRAELEGRVAKMEAELKARTAMAVGGVYFLQTTMHLKCGKYILAAASALAGLDNLVDGDDGVHLGRLLKTLESDCLPKVTATDLAKEGTAKRDFGRVIAKIKEWDTKGAFSDVLNRVELEFGEALKRVAEGRGEG